MVERGDEELVRGVQKGEEEALDGGARVHDPLTEHAVAHIEQDAQAYGHALVGEDRDLLLGAVFPDPERLLRESRDQMPFRVEDRRRDHDDVDSGLQPPRISDDLRLHS